MLYGNLCARIPISFPILPAYSSLKLSAIYLVFFNNAKYEREKRKKNAGNDRATESLRVRHSFLSLACMRKAACVCVMCVCCCCCYLLLPLRTICFGDLDLWFRAGMARIK